MAAVLITGRPGSGKTTVVRRVVAALGLSAGGFYTEELRQGGRRQGFQLLTLDGRRAVLASVESGSRQRVSRYGVEVANLEAVGVPAIEEAVASARLIVVDEIGKMELFSQRFRQAITAALDSGKPLLATIMLASHPFADAVKARPDARLFVLTEANRDQIYQEVLATLRGLLGS